MTHVVGGVTRTKCFRGGWNAVAVKHCDLCRSAAALLFCHADSAFMCMSCDSKLHNNNKLHARVWMCEVCEQAPAAVTCKADAASLCVTCDRDIHSANPLARRHHRIAVVPFYNATESILMKSTNEPISDSSVTTNAFDVPVNDRETGVQNDGYIPHDDHWIFPNTIVTSKIQTPDLKSMEYLFSGGSDQILEFDNYQIASSQPCGDSVVPVQTNIQPPVPSQLPERKFDKFEFGKSSFGSYLNGYTTQSFSHSVSTSSMDVGVVPDGSAMSESSYPFSRNMSSSVDLVGNQCSPAVGMDREARVLRYKEKRKNRKFEKTIRYASRKAYAEIRPRIKGRFAKRTDADQSDIAGIYGAVSADYIADARYGVVPSL